MIEETARLYRAILKRAIQTSPFRNRGITRDQLGKLGGNPHFLPPSRDVASDMQHGIGPNGPYSVTSRDR